MIELASLSRSARSTCSFLDQLSETIGVVLSTIIANIRTEELLEESSALAQELQSQSEELQSQQDELKRSNAELEQQAKSLQGVRGAAADPAGGAAADQRGAAGEGGAARRSRTATSRSRTREIERARASLEEQRRAARALVAVQERVPGEHEPRAAHAAELAADPVQAARRQRRRRTSTDKQVEFARTIHRRAPTCSTLISDILDLSKVEAGKMEVAPGAASRSRACSRTLERAFRPVAEQKGLELRRSRSPTTLPDAIVTDEQRARSRSCATCSPTRSSSPTAGAVELRWTRRPTSRPTAARRTRSRSRSPTPASASRRTSCG